METIHLGLFLMLCFGVHASSSEILKRQKRNWIIDSFRIDEGYNGDFPYVLDTIQIEKNLTFFKISGQGVNLDPKDILRINSRTGEITVHRPVDFEDYQVLKLEFQALNQLSRVIDTQLGIEIIILDANDNSPTFDQEIYHFNLSEATSQGTEEIKIKAMDKDRSKKYHSFDLKIVSVHPDSSDLEFYLIQHVQTGTISFKGCLDREKAEKYTIIVEAKDHGDKIELSSSCTVIIHIEDGNNHLPVITGQTGSGRVKEGEQNVLVKRLQVTDQDSKGTAAWRAKYKIQGDTNNNFRITTDRETNEGLLYVEKHLDYEDGHMKNVTISVKNELPYHICQVMHRSNTGLWVVNTGVSETGTVGFSTHQVTVIVENVNEPPIFNPSKERVVLIENVEAGKYLATLTGEDPDYANTLVYKKGDDPADWVAVDPETGNITTTKVIDRESTFVKDNTYTVTIYAVDNGQPPMTGTATLDIFITDENDNVPSLAVSTIDMCQTDGLSLANITPLDLDEEPYSGPFTFRLQEKEKGKWKLDPTQGYSVNLVKEPTVTSGQYELLLEVLDLQGLGAAYNLSVTVCNCKDPARPNCRNRKVADSTFGGAALGVFFFGMLLLAGVLLLAFLVSCKKKRIAIPDDDTHQNLMESNIEKPGTDCQVFSPFNIGCVQIPAVPQVPGTKQFINNLSAVPNTKTDDEISINRKEYLNWTMGTSATNYMPGTWTGRSKYSAYQENVIHDEKLLFVLNMMLSKQEAPGEELGDYAPHVYAEEGDTGTDPELDAISITDVSFNPYLDMDLVSKFNTLASICMPSESTAYRTKSPPQ